MAGSAPKVLCKVLSTVKNEKSSSMECAVCLQPYIHPAELPCRHIFCYLCIKGIVNQGRRCAMCRRDIPIDYLDKPILLNPVEAETTNQGFEDGHLWFYEGRNGWWQYDERTSLELESAYQKGERCCELLIAGFLYVADFDEMLQYRRNDPSKRRRIKRDLATTNKKGVAGLKTTRLTNLIASTYTEEESDEMTNPSTTNSSSVRTYTPVTSNVPTEPIMNHQQPRERVLIGLSHSTCNTAPPSNLSPHTESSVQCSRNVNFDNVIHETLDWTIEQIESLNLELLNDYEVLCRDVGNYGQSPSNLNQNRSERVAGNYLTQYSNRSYPLRESLENESEATNRGSDLPEPSNENCDSNPLPVSPRGAPRRNFLRHALGLSHEMGTSKFS